MGCRLLAEAWGEGGCGTRLNSYLTMHGLRHEGVLPMTQWTPICLMVESLPSDQEVIMTPP